MTELAKLLWCLALIPVVRSFNSSTGDSYPLDDLNDRHVLLSAPTGLTPYYVGHTFIVVTWIPPVVYINAQKHQPFEKDVPFKAVPGSYVSENKTEPAEPTSGDVTSKGDQNFTSTSQPASEDNLTPDEDSKPEEVNERKCYPLSYFANYTVFLNYTDTVNNNSYRVVTLMDSMESHQRTKIHAKPGDIIVPFEEGCLDHFRLSWTSQTKGDQGSLIVHREEHMGNITGLHPGSEYEVTVSAVYVSNHHMEVAQPFKVSTKDESENETCTCDWRGAVNRDCLGSGENQTDLCKCKYGYEGVFCQSCKPGFYRTDIDYPCHQCPCPSHSAESSTCHFVESFLVCEKCRPGYTGNICHRCSDGFYMRSGKCVPCFCNGNSQPGVERTCHSYTGQCINCQHNTTGTKCELCLPGYVGDPMSPEKCVAAPAEQETKSGGSSAGVVGALVVVVGLLAVIGLISVVWYRRYRERKARHHFWTVEMNRGQDDVDFNSVPNEDAHMEDVDDLQFYENGKSSGRGNKYSRLV